MAVNGGEKLVHGGGGIVSLRAEQDSVRQALPGDGEGGGMHTVELYRKVRLACRDEMSERAAVLHFGISRESVK